MDISSCSFPTTLELGPWEVHVFQAGPLWIDGGAMFGTLPRVVWQGFLPPDAQNRIPLSHNCLLVLGEQEGEPIRILVETGSGNKEDSRFRERLGLEDQDFLGEWLEQHGFPPTSITHVLLTHLHFDHAGGATLLNAQGLCVPRFPKARHFVQRQELEDALHPHMRVAASYPKRNVQTLLEAHLIETVDGNAEILPGIRIRPLPGHNRGHQGIEIQGGGKKLIFAGDLFPTSHHLHPAWTMGFDLDVLRCVDERQHLLEEVLDSETWVVFAHDAHHPIGQVTKDSKGKYRLKP